MSLPEYQTFERHALAQRNKWDFAKFIEPELRTAIDSIQAASLKQSRLSNLVTRAWAEGMWNGMVHQVTDEIAEFRGYAIPALHDPERVRVFVNGEPVTNVELGLQHDIANAIAPESGGRYGFRFKMAGLNVRKNDRRIEIAVGLGAPWDEPDPLRSIWLGPSTGEFPDAVNLVRIGVRTGEIEPYILYGATFTYKLERILHNLGISGFSAVGDILDWGCGCSRMIRFIDPDLHDRVTGADIDPLNIAWNKANMKGPHYTHVNVDPPMPFDAGRFGLIYANSVMTHLTEADQFAWLAELARISRPGAVVALTVHARSSWVVNGWHEAEPLYRRSLKGLLVSEEKNDDISDVEGNRYMDTSHTHEYIRDHWSKWFDIVAICENFSGTQAMVVLRAR